MSSQNTTNIEKIILHCEEMEKQVVGVILPKNYRKYILNK